MLLNKRKITEEMIRMLSAWRHSGFHVFCGARISPRDDTAMENPARYIIRASFSQERMTYLDREGTVVYAAKACPPRTPIRGRKVRQGLPRSGMAGRHACPVLDTGCSHIPNRGEQMVRHYGCYSNVSQIPAHDDHFHGDPQYSWDDCIQA